MPLSDDQKKELELFDGRRWCINSKGVKHYCCENAKGRPFFVKETNIRPGLLVVPLPPQYKAVELLNGWVRFYKIKKGD